MFMVCKEEAVLLIAYYTFQDSLKVVLDLLVGLIWSINIWPPITTDPKGDTYLEEGGIVLKSSKFCQ